MMDYESLAALAAIVREGSFERAAQTLSVTPSAVSQRLKLLEERLGAVLLVRGQPCRATAVGARLCAHVDQVRLLESEILSELRLGGAADIRPTIRVAVNSDSLITWFAPAAAAFSRKTGALLDLVLDDEKHTANRLRSGEVLAAVTAEPKPVQGCRILPLGSLRYLATASPDFLRAYFPRGINADSLSHAPVLQFDRRDSVQALWAKQALGLALAAPVHWAPSTQAFIDLSVAGLAWGMNPEVLAAPHMKAGRLAELAPGKPLDVELYWQYSRLGAKLLNEFTAAVRAAAKKALRRRD